MMDESAWQDYRPDLEGATRGSFLAV